MLKYIVTIILSILLPLSSSAMSDSQLKLYLENILNSMTYYIDDIYIRGDPRGEEEAKLIFNASLAHAAFDNFDNILDIRKAFGKDIGYNLSELYLVPEKFVETAICKYYGFEAEKYAELENVLERESYGKYYLFHNYFDGIFPKYKINTIIKIDKDLLKVKGIQESEDGNTPFIAYFLDKKCKGKNYWVLIRVIVNDNFEYQRRN